MKVITCASYYGSGSSAITDLVSEYNTVKSLTDYEIRIIHEIDGISDLEYHLVECPNRHNSGHALKRFEKLAKFFAGSQLIPRYETFFNGKYWILTEDYINSLLDFKFKGNRFADWYDRGTIFYYYQSILKKIWRKLNISINTMPYTYQYYSHPSESRFLECTKKYTSKLLEAANTSGSDIIVVDQLLPSSNINRCLRYFNDDVFVVVVDRDPRDVFLTNKYVWKDAQVPIEPNSFCEWFIHTHNDSANETWDDSRIKKIYFEDLIYKYSDTCKLIEGFLNLNPHMHVNKFKYLNPKRSVVNTRLWEKYNDNDSIEIIETKLRRYLYDYSQLTNNGVVEGEPTEDNTVF